MSRAMNWESFEGDEDAAPRTRSASIEEFIRPPLPPDPAEIARQAEEEARRAEEEALADMLARARGEGKAEGFEQGAAQAESSFIAERRMILSDIRERLADSALMRERADAEAAAALRALSEALVRALAPALGRSGLAAEVAEAVAAAHADQLSARGDPHVAVAARPEQLPAIQAALDEAGLEAELVADERLGALEARASWGEGIDAIDLDRCVDAAMAAIAAHFHTEDEEVRAHG